MASTTTLRLIDPTTNRFRHYTVEQSRTLFGDHALLVTWGRIGKTPRTRCEVFTSEVELVRRRAELLATRRNHGYNIGHS